MWKIKEIVSKGEYNYAIVHNHPYRTINIYVLHHRIVMENHLGRLLSPSEVVHHKNKNKKDNRLENLEVMSFIDHCKLHANRGRLMVELKCPNCSKIFMREARQTFLVKRQGRYTTCSCYCRGKFSSQIQHYRITHEMELAISENLRRYFYSDNSEETD